jgi:hypothetical protein
LDCYENRTLGRQGRYFKPIGNQGIGTPLDRSSALENTILPEHFHGGPRLEKEVRASRKHEVRCSLSCLYYVSLKESRVAPHNCTIDLGLTAGDDDPYAGRRRSNANQAAAG